MAKFQIAIGIDIGTDTIKILAVKKDIESGRVSDIIFMDQVKSAGVQKGRIKNVNEAAKKLKNY